MYDPARDTFDSSNDVAGGEPEATEQNMTKSKTPSRPPASSVAAASHTQTLLPKIPFKQPHSPLVGQPQPLSPQTPLDHDRSPSKGQIRSSSPPQKSRKRGRSPDDHAQSQSQSSAQKRSKRVRSTSPTPPPKSPPRQRKRPGAASRIATAEKEALRQRQIEREQEQLKDLNATVLARGVHDVVRQHYNAVPQRGRDWRKTDSRIRGLRSYNNWVKSTLIHKFSPSENFTSEASHTRGGDQRGPGLLVLDIGCGKGGDLGKWQKAPQPVALYVGIDPAEVSIRQARDRYSELLSRDRSQRLFQGEFFAKDGFGEWLGDIPVIKEVGIDGGVGPGGGGSARWGGGGFDVVTMMFCMHYAFESEAKARGMLKNVAGSLNKGGRFIGVIPNSDVLRTKVQAFHKDQAVKRMKSRVPSENAGVPQDDNDTEDGEVEDVAILEWGNDIYSVRFPGKTPEDGVFRPPFGWKYSYFMKEAVEEVPEYVVPWEAFRALAEDYNLEMQYRKPFADIWKEEKDDVVLGPLSMRMGVKESMNGPSVLTPEELEAVAFYHAFCFYKV